MDQYIGIDILKDTSHATVKDKKGGILKQGEFENLPTSFDNFFDGINKAEIAIEACGAWQPAYDYLSENGFDVMLAHPFKTRIIA